jgi:hypothetical protein
VGFVATAGAFVPVWVGGAGAASGELPVGAEGGATRVDQATALVAAAAGGRLVPELDGVAAGNVVTVAAQA